MASTSVTMTIPEKDASLQVLTSIMEKLNKEEQQKLEPHLSEIQEHIIKLVEDVPEEKVKRKRREAIFAAAVYDTFLQYQPHTQTKISVRVIAECLGLKSVPVNSAWLALFDHRVKLEPDKLERARGKSKNPKHLISEVMTNLKRAVPQTSEKLSTWFSDIEKDATDLFGLLDKDILKDYPLDELAAAAVYGVIRKQGKPMIPLSRQDASLLCGTSQATIFKLWADFFRDEDEA